MIRTRFDDALEAFREWEGWADDEYPDDYIRVPLEAAIEACNKEAE